MSINHRLNDAYFGAINIFLPAQISGAVLVLGGDSDFFISIKEKYNNVYHITKDTDHVCCVGGLRNQLVPLSSESLSSVINDIEVMILLEEDISLEFSGLGLVCPNVKFIVSGSSNINTIVEKMFLLDEFLSDSIYLRSTGEVFNPLKFNNTFTRPMRMYFERMRAVKNTVLKLGLYIPFINKYIFDNEIYFLKRNNVKYKSLFDKIIISAVTVLNEKRIHVQRCMVTSAHVVIMELICGNAKKQDLLVRVPLNCQAKNRHNYNCSALSKVDGEFMGVKAPKLLLNENVNELVYSFETIVQGLDSWEITNKISPTISAANKLFAMVGEIDEIVDSERSFNINYIWPYFSELIRVDVFNEEEAQLIFNRICDDLAGVNLKISPRHGDFKLDNMRVIDGEIVGIFDFDLYSEKGISILDLIHLIGSNYYDDNINDIEKLVVHILIPHRFKDYEVELFENFPGFSGFDHKSWKTLSMLYWLDHMVSRHISVLTETASHELKDVIRIFLSRKY